MDTSDEEVLVIAVIAKRISENKPIKKTQKTLDEVMLAKKVSTRSV